MSTCISRWGEFSAHTIIKGNFICEDCGALDEDRIFKRLDEAEWLIRTDHKLGRHDTYGADFTCKGCAWLRDGATR